MPLTDSAQKQHNCAITVTSAFSTTLKRTQIFFENITNATNKLNNISIAWMVDQFRHIIESIPSLALLPVLSKKPPCDKWMEWGLAVSCNNKIDTTAAHMYVHCTLGTGQHFFNPRPTFLVLSLPLCLQWNNGRQWARDTAISIIIGPIPGGHSGPLCHALSSLASWTSMRRRHQ